MFIRDKNYSELKEFTNILNDLFNEINLITILHEYQYLNVKFTPTEGETGRYRAVLSSLIEVKDMLSNNKYLISSEDGIYIIVLKVWDTGSCGTLISYFNLEDSKDGLMGIKPSQFKFYELPNFINDLFD